MTVRRTPRLTLRQRYALELCNLGFVNLYTERSMDSLIRRGLVRREMKGSRRTGVYHLTNEGHDLLARMKAARQASR